MAVAKAQDTSGLSDDVEKCISSCDSDDVNCIAHCTPVSSPGDSFAPHESQLTCFDQVPSPDEDNLTALNDCVGNCDQGSGSETDTTAYGDCVQQCVVENCKIAPRFS